MHRTTRFRVAASLFVVMIAAACGSDSTAPSQSPSSIAARFDSLYVDASSRLVDDGAYALRSILMTLFELPPALGASPSTISVTTASGVEHWKAFQIDELYSQSDSGFYLLAYRESAAHTALLMQYAGDGSFVAGVLLTNDTLAVSLANADGSTALTSTSSTCGTPSSSLVNPAMGDFDFTGCALAKFKTSVTISTAMMPSIDPALESIVVNQATVNGVRVQDVEEAATLRRLRAALHAYHTTKRL